MRIPRWFLQKFGCTFPISNILTLVAISTTDNLKLDIDIFPLTIAVMTSSLGVATEVIFFSRLWHEVLPSERVRRALTLWILRPEEEESWIPAVFWFAFWSWHCAWQWSLRSGDSLHGGKFQEVQYPGAVQESKSPTFDDVTLGGILCLSQFSSLVKIQLRWVDEHECLVTLWYLESRRPEAESRMQLQSAMHGHIGLAIWFAKPVSRQVMTNDNEQRAVKHLAAWLAHVCIWICVDLDLRNGQKFPAFFRLRRWMWFLHRSCHWVLRKGTRCRGPCGLRGCGLRQSFAERLSVIPTRTNEHTFSIFFQCQVVPNIPAVTSHVVMLRWRKRESVSQRIQNTFKASQLCYVPSEDAKSFGGNLFAAWAQGKGECFCFISILTCLHIPHTIS